MAYTGVLFSNTSNTVIQTGRRAAMTVRFCRPDQKANSSAYTNCKLLQSCSL